VSIDKRRDCANKGTEAMTTESVHFPPRIYLHRLSNLFRRDYQQAWRCARRIVAGREQDVGQHLNYKLWRYLKYCKQYSAFWQDRWPSEWEHFSPDEAPVVLEALPALTKEELREHAEALRIRPAQRRPDDGFPPIRNQSTMFSGGSTGVPTAVWQDRRWKNINRAMVDFAYRQTGLEPGTPTFYLWGSNNELSELKASLSKRLSTFLRGLIVLPAFSMSEDRMDEFLATINRRREVDSALCFVTALDTLTDYIARTGQQGRRLRRVIAGGGTLYPELRQRVLETLAHEVFDMYGSRDMGIMAMETREHNGLGVFQWHNYLEVLDDNLRRCEPGRSGRVFATALENYSTTLIRMDMGDMAVVGSPADANWHMMVLRRLEGRSAEHLVSPDGARIEPAAVIHLIGVLIRPEWLRRFQVIQRQMDGFEVKVETWGPVSPDKLQYFSAHVKQAMSKLCHCDVSVDLIPVEQITPSRSGKYSYCVSMVAPSGGTKLKSLAGDRS